ncbi:kinase-like protein [Calocera cornea HHB12733]|uniref:Kinase-like protein n=1 Tax=Calocera cornea HHB12733 TaxID=1353952 RepID=A0A165G2W1_9BASI|nr:kinase-like protein [Calocera cornea HHB12733]
MQPTSPEFDPRLISHLQVLDATRSDVSELLNGVEQLPEYGALRRLQYEVISGRQLLAEVEPFMEKEDKRFRQQRLAPHVNEIAIKTAEAYIQELEALRSSMDYATIVRRVTEKGSNVDTSGRDAAADEAPSVLRNFGPDLTSLVQPISNTAVDHGGYADVFQGIFRPNGPGGPEIKVGMKSFRNYDLPEVTPTPLGGMLREIMVAQQLKHPNILLSLGIARLIVVTSQPYCLISPWMDNGNVVRYLRANPNANRYNILCGVANGLQFLHTMQPFPVVHGDIKGTNILIDDDGNAQLADFGLARLVDYEELVQTPPSMNGTGTVGFMAPERVFCDRFGLTVRQVWAPPIDVFSYGALIYEVYKGHGPFYELPAANVLQLQTRVMNMIGEGAARCPGAVAPESSTPRW